MPGFSTTEGAQLEQWTSNGGSNQQWKFVSQGNGYYTIVNLNSGDLVDVAALSTANNAIVDQWPGNGGANQQWSLSVV